VRPAPGGTEKTQWRTKSVFRSSLIRTSKPNPESNRSTQLEYPLAFKPIRTLTPVCFSSRCGQKPSGGSAVSRLRHHAITELAESQVSDQTIMAIAGHVSQKMLARYSHVRSEARRKAVAALSARPTGLWFRADEEAHYDTNNDTTGSEAPSIRPEVIERNGRLVGTRTPDLHRVKVAL